MKYTFPKRVIVAVLCSLPILLLASATRAQETAAPPGEGADRVQRITVSANGVNREDALRRALRAALEQGAGVEIASHSQSRNFNLIRETVYGRASGVITEYRVLEEQPAPGNAVTVKVEATVRAESIARTWGEVQNLLEQLGRPKIMVLIDESIDEQHQPDSVVASKIEELFLKSGFDLVSRSGANAALQREIADAARSGDGARSAALAKENGAHILIRGTANSNRAGLQDIYGVPAAFYNCDVQVQVYYADTGRLLASESMPITRMGVRSRHEFSPQAARAALVQATFPEKDNPALPTPLAMRVYDAVMEAWSTQLTAGGDVEVDIDGLDYKSFTNLRRSLSEIADVKSVDAEFSKSVGQFRMKTTLTAAALAERLTRPPFDAWLEVTEQKQSRVSAKAVARP